MFLILNSLIWTHRIAGGCQKNGRNGWVRQGKEFIILERTGRLLEACDHGCLLEK